MPQSKSKKQTILLVDDDVDVLEMLEANLGQAGYKIKRAENGLDAFVIVQSEKVDLAILDIGLPDISGLLLCKKIRNESKRKDLPIIILTGEAGEEVQIEALESGADDIIVKSTSVRVILGHVRAIFRRIAGFEIEKEKASALVVDDLTIDRERYLVFKVEGEERKRIHFPRKEFELLYLLANNRGRVFTRDELLDTVWGTDIYVTPRTVDVHVRKVRLKISSEYIETVTGVGYRFKD